MLLDVRSAVLAPAICITSVHYIFSIHYQLFNTLTRYQSYIIPNRPNLQLQYVVRIILLISAF